ncbi:tryptophan 7-halogenase [Pelagibius sp. 7325]|uniref:NAD(P)/FAD-dependent oxidoreductase n=1 Tax=Pelagibius sp. 7325 TaxID=3131994 RepID=UPI0030EC0009
MSLAESCDVAVVGAGPAGAVAAAILARKGYEVVVLERQTFPRFSIGESLLPQCMVFLDEAGMTGMVEAAGFQLKDGAAFDRGGLRSSFDFSDKTAEGRSTTFQVQRARFDKILADEAEKVGAAVHYRHEIVDARFTDEAAYLIHVDEENTRSSLKCRYCLDASGFGKSLSGLLGLDQPSAGGERTSIFTHIRDGAAAEAMDRNKILITVHPVHHDVWFWLIPFSDGTSSLGVVGPGPYFSGYSGDPLSDLRAIVAETGLLGDIVRTASFDLPVRRVSGYASRVSRLYGPRFALLGNAGGFIDPVFSSGVTIALKSASLAAAAVDRELSGGKVDWEHEFAAPLNLGVETFRQFVSAWYDTSLQDIIFAKAPNPRIRRMICSILAGYAWDSSNPYVVQPRRRLAALSEMCRQQR